MSATQLLCDYLVIGAGAASIALIDTVLTEHPTAKILLVDKNPVPGALGQRVRLCAASSAIRHVWRRVPSTRGKLDEAPTRQIHTALESPRIQG